MAPQHDARSASAGPERGRSIVLVEDQDASRAMLKMLLELDGHEVAEARDGLSAVRLVERRGTPGGRRPDVVIVDITLPDIDGYEVARRIRGLGIDVRLVALTGYGRPEDIAQSEAAGFDHHLTKPLDPDVLSRIIGDG